MKKKYLIFISIMLLSSCKAESNKNVIHQIEITTNILDSKSYVENNITVENYKKVNEIVAENDDERILLNLDSSNSIKFDESKIFNDILEYPKIDGSTALMPLMAKVMEKTCGISKEESENRTTCSKTAKAWRKLFHKEADILIVGEIPDVVRYELEDEYIEDKNLFEPLLYAPIRREGLVFITHKNNPVENLTREQLINIYTGKIDNWSQVGGDNIKIKAYQRNVTSGSQANFIKCLMKDINPIKMEADYYIGDMSSLAEKVKIYENDECAIGYSVYYYINNMILNDNLKMIKVDGIMPSNETIEDGSYPLITESYVAIRKNESDESSARKLYNYIRSNKGREAIIEANYVPIK